MKGKFKVQAIRRIAGIIAILAIIGFSMMACGGDDGDKIMGLSYKDKFDTTDYQGGVVHIYVLNHTYSEALSILTKELGSNYWEAGMQGTNAAYNKLDSYGDWVALEDCVGLKDYRLIRKAGRGTGWDYP